MSRTLARELGLKGMGQRRPPGYIWGDSLEWYFNFLAEKRGTTFQEVYDEVAAETCLGYLPSSEEIAGAVVFFASDLAKAVTGQSIGVNAATGSRADVSFIEINLTHGTLSFGAEIVKPKVRIDGGPELVLPGWRPGLHPGGSRTAPG